MSGGNHAKIQSPSPRWTQYCALLPTPSIRPEWALRIICRHNPRKLFHTGEMTTPVELLIEPRNRPVGNMTVQRLLPFRQRRMVGPFIFVDQMGPVEFAIGDGMNVDSHPHIGLATVTYLLDGRAVHRDSTGAVATIESGAINWMRAGSGVTHTERSHPDDLVWGATTYGLQTWVALPDEAEESDPGFSHHPADSLPEDSHGGHRIRMLAGTGWGMTSTVPVASPTIMAELHINPDATDGIRLDRTHAERCVLALDQDLFLDGYRLPQGHLAVIETGNDPVITGGGRAMVLGGEPVGKRYMWWNFVSSSQDRLEQAKQDWREQRFPTVPDDHEPWVPLPE